MLGRAPIVDFDGTLARLDVAWAPLRSSLGVRRIDDLWARHDADAWDTVTGAERAAASTAEPVEAVLTLLERVEAVAVLTSNSERAVEAFLQRFPALEARVSAIVGRETLAGPKSSFDVFANGYGVCVGATARARGTEPVVYVGDMAYELEFANRLGARAYDVDDLERGR